MPAATPSGSDVSIVTIMISVVPTQAERMPACAARREGNDVKNCQDNCGRPSRSRSQISAPSVISPIAIEMNPSTPKSMSVILRRRMSDFRSVTTPSERLRMSSRGSLGGRGISESNGARTPRSLGSHSSPRDDIAHELCGSYGCSSVHPPVALEEEVPADVEDQRHQHQRQSGREDRLVADAPVRQI